jgi:Lrp/AsnC family transcriptional regulator, leucine-responsive regulatory protein
MKELRLDDLDRRLLAELARNGSLSNTELAARLPLSHSAISRRITRLEREGAIRGYGRTLIRLRWGSAFAHS